MDMLQYHRIPALCSTQAAGWNEWGRWRRGYDPHRGKPAAACRSPFSTTSTLETVVLEALRKPDIERRIRVRVATVSLLAHIVAETDLIATLGKGLASHHAGTLPINVHPFPFPSSKLAMRMVWHDRTHQSGLHIWVRQLIREVSR